MVDAGSAVPMPDASSLLGNPRTLAEQLGLSRNVDARTVARKFEAMFWSMVINRLRTAMTEEGLFPGDQADAYGALFDMFLADYLAEHSSLGVARMIERYLERREQADASRAQQSTAPAAHAEMAGRGH